MVENKYRSALDTEGEKFAEKVRKDPSHFIQPTMHIEERTGREYINPEYVKRYGNPYNDINKSSIYLEISEKDIAEKQRAKSKSLESADYVIFRCQWLLKHHQENIQTHEAIVCKFCTAMNADVPHCFNCSNPIAYTTYNLI